MSILDWTTKTINEGTPFEKVIIVPPQENKLISLIANDNTHVTVQADGSVYLVQEHNDSRDTQQIINISKSDLMVMLSILKLNGIEGITL